MEAQMTIQGKHIAKYFHSQSEWREWLKVTRAQVENGLTLSGAQTTLARFLSEWLIAISSSIRPKILSVSANCPSAYHPHIGGY